MKNLLFVVNVDWFFVSHRLPIAIEAVKAGYKVSVATTITDKKDEIEKHGIEVHSLKIDRGLFSIFEVIALIFRLTVLFFKEKPDIVHLVTIKPVILGGIAARLLNIKSIVYAISGMGFVYTAQGRIAVFRKSLVSFLYKLALRTDGSQIIFQNNYDLEMLSRIKFLPESSVSMIKGSGVDLTRFRPNPSYRVKKPKVVMAARLLKDKGVIEFVEAARILSAEMEAAAEFLLVGEVDLSNPASLQKEEVEQLQKESFIKCMGHREDMENILQEAAIFVLPSYREGLPKVVLEASACGKPVITTDVPGCRDAITPAVTGLLVPPRDVGSLALSIKYLLQNESKREEFGIAGRKQAVREFDLELVIQKHLEIYALLVRDAQ